MSMGRDIYDIFFYDISISSSIFFNISNRLSANTLHVLPILSLILGFRIESLFLGIRIVLLKKKMR